MRRRRKTHFIPKLPNVIDKYCQCPEESCCYSLSQSQSKKKEMAWNPCSPAMTHYWEHKSPGEAIGGEDPIQEDAQEMRGAPKIWHTAQTVTAFNKNIQCGLHSFIQQIFEDLLQKTLWGLDTSEIFLLKEPTVYYNVQRILEEFKEKRDDLWL